MGQQIPITSPGIEFVRAHVPAGQSIIYVTRGTSNDELLSYYLLSYAMAPGNAVWWAVAARPTRATDWWQDVSGGSASIRELAASKHARYVVFTGTGVPTDLNPTAAWKMDSRFAVVMLSG